MKVYVFMGLYNIKIMWLVLMFFFFINLEFMMKLGERCEVGLCKGGRVVFGI